MGGHLVHRQRMVPPCHSTWGAGFMLTSSSLQVTVMPVVLEAYCRRWSSRVPRDRVKHNAGHATAREEGAWCLGCRAQVGRRQGAMHGPSGCLVLYKSVAGGCMQSADLCTAHAAASWGESGHQKQSASLRPGPSSAVICQAVAGPVFGDACDMVPRGPCLRMPPGMAVHCSCLLTAGRAAGAVSWYDWGAVFVYSIVLHKPWVLWQEVQSGGTCVYGWALSPYAGCLCFAAGCAGCCSHK